MNNGSLRRRYALLLLLMASAGVGLALVLAGWNGGRSFYPAALSAISVMGIIAFCARRLLATEIRNAQKAVAEFESLTEALPQIIWRVKPNGNAAYLSPRFVELTGNHGNTIAEKLESIHPDDRQSYTDGWMQAENTADALSMRFRLRHADGEYRWMLSEGRAVRDMPNGRIIRWIGVLSDIDKLVSAQEELKLLSKSLAATLETRRREVQLSEQRFEALFHDLHIAYAELDIREAKRLLTETHDRGGNFSQLSKSDPELIEQAAASVRMINVNAVFATMIGFAEIGELLETPVTTLLKDAQRVLHLQLEAIFTGRRHFTTYATLLARDGNVVPVAICVNFTEDWSTMIVTHVDITERQRTHEVMLGTREELARANRAATVGAMSASLAHELNQPILAIHMDAQAASRWVRKEPPVLAKAVGAVKRISSNLGRMEEIVRRTGDRLLGADNRVRPIDLAELLVETRDLIERDMRARNIGLRLVVDTADTTVVANRTEVQQVIVNLINNAADAMASIARRSEIVVSISKDDGNIRVAVDDDGPGIDDGLLDAIFEPFFSTKPGGMGMGLQICRSIIESFGGQLMAENRVEGGARFCFKLKDANGHRIDDAAISLANCLLDRGAKVTTNERAT